MTVLDWWNVFAMLAMTALVGLCIREVLIGLCGGWKRPLAALLVTAAVFCGLVLGWKR